MNPICDIVVPLYNKIEHTKTFIETLTRHTHLPVRIIFVDDASSDETPQYIASLKATKNIKFQIFTNENNQGYIRSANRGLIASHAPYVCIANNDLKFTENWFSECIEVLKTYREVGLVSPSSNTTGLHLPKDVDLNDFAKKVRKENKEIFKEMNFCSGFCMVMKREVVEKAGFLSEDFIPMFFEDNDFSVRVQEKGYSIGVALRSYVWHEEHASINQFESKKVEEIFQKSKDTFEKKWGRILRLGVICLSPKDLDKNLHDILALGKGGDSPVALLSYRESDDKEILKRNNLPLYKNLNTRRFTTLFGLLWVIIVKKKQFDFIAAPNKILCGILRMLGQTASNHLDFEAIEKLKKP